LTKTSRAKILTLLYFLQQLRPAPITMIASCGQVRPSSIIVKIRPVRVAPIAKCQYDEHQREMLMAIPGKGEGKKDPAKEPKRPRASRELKAG
jgi:hypothetical protein